MTFSTSFRTRGRLIGLCCLLLPLLMLASCKSEEEQVADFMERGEAHVEEGRTKEAIIEFRNVIKVDPNDAAGHYALAQAYLKQGQLKQGYWELRETVRLDPSNLDARLRFGVISIAARDFEEVLAQASAVNEGDPERADAWNLRAQALEGLDRADEAEEFYLRAEKLDPENSDHRVARAQYYVRSERNDDAEAVLLQMVEKAPDYRAHTLLARFYMTAKNFDDAEASFKAAIELAASDGRKEAAYINYSSFLNFREREDEAFALLYGAKEILVEKSSVLFTLAGMEGARGNSDKADSLIEQAAAESPDDPRPHLVLSAYRSERGDLEGALAAAEAALVLDPEHMTARLRKAELLIDLGYRGKDVAKIAAGRSIVDRILASQPSNPPALFVRAKLELAEGSTESAVVSLRAAIDGKPNWAQAHFVLGTALAMRNDKSGARMELARSLELDGNMLEARKTLARIHAQLGEHEYAIEQGRIYLARDPDDAQTRIMVAQSLVRLGKLQDSYRELRKIPEESRDSEVQYAIARVQLARGKNEESLAMLIEVNDARACEYEILRSMLIVEARLGKLDDTSARLGACIEAQPSNSSLALLRGEVALAQGDLEAAEEWYLKATELDPANVAAYSKLAAYYQRTGRLDETIDAYKKALEVRPDNGRMHHITGVLYEHRGDTALAMEQYEQAIANDPTLGDAKNNLAYLLAESGETLDRALDLAQEAKALLPDSPNTADTLGWVLYKRGVASAAVGYLREAEAGMNPDDQALGVIRYHLALAYEENDEAEKAIQSLDRALGLLETGGTDEDPSWAAEVRSMRDRLGASPQS